MNAFDRIIWRINGIVLCGLLLVGPVVLGGSIMWYMKRGTQRYVQTAMKNNDVDHQEYLRFGSMDRIDGRSIYQSKLYAVKDKSFRLNSKSAFFFRNVMFYDPDTGQQHFVFDHHQRFISKEYTLYNEPHTHYQDKTDAITQAFIYEVSSHDTNGDGQVDWDDRVTLYVTDYQGRHLKTITEDVDDVINIEQRSPEAVLIFIVKANNYYVLEYNFLTGEMIKEQRVDSAVKK